MGQSWCEACYQEELSMISPHAETHKSMCLPSLSFMSAERLFCNEETESLIKKSFRQMGSFAYFCAMPTFLGDARHPFNTAGDELQ